MNHWPAQRGFGAHITANHGDHLHTSVTCPWFVALLVTAWASVATVPASCLCVLTDTAIKAIFQIGWDWFTNMGGGGHMLLPTTVISCTTLPSVHLLSALLLFLELL